MYKDVAMEEKNASTKATVLEACKHVETISGMRSESMDCPSLSVLRYYLHKLLRSVYHLKYFV